MASAKMFDLSGKASIVTGGNRGIGRGLALGLAEAEELKRAVVFLASSGSDNMTGADLLIDGGFSIR